MNSCHSRIPQGYKNGKEMMLMLTSSIIIFLSGQDTYQRFLTKLLGLNAQICNGSFLKVEEEGPKILSQSRLHIKVMS